MMDSTARVLFHWRICQHLTHYALVVLDRSHDDHEAPRAQIQILRRCPVPLGSALEFPAQAEECVRESLYIAADQA
jgi:hypothetical protein